MSIKRFHLRRTEDESGISGTGRVAEGVLFSDGVAAMRWLTERRSTCTYANVADLIAIHGHGGKTLVVFEDCPGCDHPWPHHWMDNCGGCDVPRCPCAAMGSLPPGCVSAPDPDPLPKCVCGGIR